MAAFMAAPVFGFNGTLAGVIAIRITPDVVASVAGDPVGLGDTGDILLIGDDGSLRIDTKPRQDGESLVQNLNADVVGKALKGQESAGAYTTTGGTRALIAAAPLASLGTDWAVAAVVWACSAAFRAAPMKPSSASLACSTLFSAKARISGGTSKFGLLVLTSSSIAPCPLLVNVHDSGWLPRNNLNPN